MSNEDNKTHGGKGVNTPKPEADKNYRDNFGDSEDRTRHHRPMIKSATAKNRAKRARKRDK